MSFDQQHLRMVEALLFAASEPFDMESIRARLPNDLDVPAVLEILEGKYRERGVNVVQIAGKWTLRTAPDLKFLLQKRTCLRLADLQGLVNIQYSQNTTRCFRNF